MSSHADTIGPAAVAKEVLRLWPEGPPRRIEGVPAESTFSFPQGPFAGLGFLRNVSEPTITVYRPAPSVANRRAVVIFPGGGFRVLAWEHEGEQVADWFARLGFTALLLKYRLQKTPSTDDAFFELMGQVAAAALNPNLSDADAPRRIDFTKREADNILAGEIAAQDGREALRLARANADAWGIDADKVGVLGFSAGASAAVDVTLDPPGAAPAFLAAIYGGDTRRRPLPPDAPPLFAVVAQDDRSFFRVVETLYSDWCEANLTAELHVFARGAHGFGMKTIDAPCDSWTRLLRAFLDDIGGR